MYEKNKVEQCYSCAVLFQYFMIQEVINFVQRLCGTGDVILYTIDRTSPVVVLKNIKDPFKVKNFLSELCLKEHRANHIIEMM